MNKAQTNTIEVAKKDYEKKLFSFGQSLKTLKEMYDLYINKPDEKSPQMSFPKSFELTFELSWKTLQSFFKSQGFTEAISPKSTIKLAFNKGFITKDQIWIDMLDARNKLSHIYDENMLKGITKRISKEYIQELKKLYQKLKEEN